MAAAWAAAAPVVEALVAAVVRAAVLTVEARVEVGKVAVATVARAVEGLCGRRGRW